MSFAPSVWSKGIRALCILALLVFLPCVAFSQGYTQITAEKARQVIASTPDVIVLDVRTEEEFLKGHLANAVRIPYNELEQRAFAELPDKNATIVIYCKSGRRSLIAAEILAKLGYAKLYEFNGIDNWPYEVSKK